MKETDLCNTPTWLLNHFKYHFDPCPPNPIFNGLEIEWPNLSFVNPPYSDVTPWINKAIIEQRKGKNIVMLLNVDPSTKWYRLLVEAGAHFCYFNERLKFIHQNNGEFKSNNSHASMLVYLNGAKYENNKRNNK